MSSTELEQYKREQLLKLREQYTASVAVLRDQLASKINAVNKLNVSRYLKLSYIAILRTNYNSAISKVTAEYVRNQTQIQTLTQIPNSKKYGLLVGINYIGTPSQLSGCINDTRNIKNMLQQSFGYEQFTILTEETNKKPTKKNILEAFTNLLVQSKEGDSLFFLYSGHGTCTIDLNGDEMDGQDEMIVPLDGTSVSSCILDDEMNRIIRANMKDGVKLFMLFDSCFSGTMVDLKYNYVENSSSPVINSTSTNPKGQVIMISGCRDDQTSADTYVQLNGVGTYSGAMTFSFLKTIQEFGTKVRMKTLIDNMRSMLQQNGYSQIPQLSSGHLMNTSEVEIPL
jgi:hypothetical protein